MFSQQPGLRGSGDSLEDWINGLIFEPSFLRSTNQKTAEKQRDATFVFRGAKSKDLPAILTRFSKR
jgi:hypothetical protein